MPLCVRALRNSCSWEGAISKPSNRRKDLPTDPKPTDKVVSRTARQRFVRHTYFASYFADVLCDACIAVDERVARGEGSAASITEPRVMGAAGAAETRSSAGCLAGCSAAASWPVWTAKIFLAVAVTAYLFRCLQDEPGLTITFFFCFVQEYKI